VLTPCDSTPWHTRCSVGTVTEPAPAQDKANDQQHGASLVAWMAPLAQLVGGSTKEVVLYRMRIAVQPATPKCPARIRRLA